MNDRMRERSIAEATYIIETNATVREVAKKFCVSKTTVHKDLTVRLIKINPALAKEVKKVFAKNIIEGHRKGGLATRKKHLKNKNN